MSKKRNSQILNIIDTKGCLAFPLNLLGNTILENTAHGAEVKKLAADNGKMLCSAKIEAEAKAAAEKVAAERAALEKIVADNKDEVIALTKSHFRHFAGSLVYEDFGTRYFNNNTPLHIIFSLNEELQTLSAIKNLQELFNDGKIAGKDLRTIFEAENADSLTPIEILLESSAQTIVAVGQAIKHLEFLKLFSNANSKNGTICEIAGKRLYEESQAAFYKELEKIVTQTAAHALIVSQCLDKFMTSFMTKIAAELKVAVYKHRKVDIRAKTSELYKLVQSNSILKTKFLDLLDIESIDHAVTEVYSSDAIKDKLRLIEQTERLRLDSLLDHDINMVNIELSFNRIANLNTTLYKSGLVANNFGYTVVRSIKAKLNLVLNKAIQLVKTANEEELKNAYEVALETIKPYEPIYIKRGFDDLEQHLKNAVDNRVSDFLQDVCKAQENYHNQQEAGECLDKLYAFKQQYSFLRPGLCFVQKAAGEQYLEEGVQYINNGKNLFSDFTCKEKATAIAVPLVIVGTVGLYMSGAGMAGAALASGMFLLGLDVNKRMDASDSIFTGSSLGAVVTGLSYLEHGPVYGLKAAALGSIIGGTITGLGEIVGAVIDKALDCE